MSVAEDTNWRLELAVRGMHCAGCVATVEGALRRVPGVVSASANLATEHATVWLAPDAKTPPAPLQRAAGLLVAAVRAAGYDATLASTSPRRPEQSEQRSARLRRLRTRLLIALLFGLPVVAWHLGLAWLPAGARAAHGSTYVWAVQAVLTAAAFLVAAGPMMAGALRGLAVRSANMDLLVSLGALTAFASSFVGIATGRSELIFFDAAVMIVLFVSVGKYLEALARGQASAAFEVLWARMPQTALRVTGDHLEAVPIESVQVGDRLRVAAHATVPVDGQVAAGRATLDEGMLTGEALPVERATGDLVFGGTRVVDGLLEIRATATGSASAAARIATLVEQAQANKPPWQRFADRAASVFVPAVLLLAGATFVGWKWLAGAETSWALERMIAALVVACPCALGLAIPTAVLVGTTRAAGRGILVRDATALEAAGQVREVLLDKTGTLTMGRPALERIQLCGRVSETDVLRAAAALAQLSAHPLARALAEAVQQRGLLLPDATDFRSQPGGGLCGQVAGDRVVMGSAAWLSDNEIDTAPPREQADALSAEGFSVVWVALNGHVAALLTFADRLHPESTAALEALRKLGVRARILSGDRPAAVRYVADRLHVGMYEAQLSPAQKLQRVRELVAQGRRVAMVGDGINDAPALAAADVGIAIGTGADVAREAADICLVGHSPRLIAEAVRISRSSARIMKQNLAWAVAYNLVMLPVAILAPLPPALATAAMMCSSLSVVGNSLRLRRVI